MICNVYAWDGRGPLRIYAFCIQLDHIFFISDMTHALIEHDHAQSCLISYTYSGLLCALSTT